MKARAIKRKRKTRVGSGTKLTHLAVAGFDAEAVAITGMNSVGCEGEMDKNIKEPGSFTLFALTAFAGVGVASYHDNLGGKVALCLGVKGVGCGVAVSLCA